MSHANVEKIRQIIVADTGLSTRLAGAGDEASFVSTILAIGSERGIPVTVDDVESWKSNEGATIEIDESHLEQVAGGRATRQLTKGYVSYGDSLLCGFCGGSSGTSREA